MEWRAARRRSTLSPGSVMAVKWCPSSPDVRRATASIQISIWVNVSAVEPDLEITRKPVRAKSSAAKRAWNVSGSTLSMNQRRGAPGSGPKPRSASAQMVWPARLDPPVPSTTTSSKSARKRSATACKDAKSSIADGRRSSGKLLSSRAAFSPASAPGVSDRAAS